MSRTSTIADASRNATVAESSRPLLEEVGCRACRSEKRAPYGELSGYRFHRCLGCGLVYMSPRPTVETLMALYDERYFLSDDPRIGYAVYEADRVSLRDKSERLLRDVERWVSPGRLLDVGCAHGFLLEVAKEHGWQVAGIEPARGVAEKAASRLGAPIHSDLLEARYPDDTFDAIAMWDVVEHLPDPHDFFLEIRRILKPTGVVSVVTPDLGSLAARVLGERWEEKQKMPEHIYFFNKRSLSRLFESVGFEAIRWGSVGKLMPLREAAARLAPAFPWLFRPLERLLASSGLGEWVVYLDPRWKLSVLLRLKAHDSR